MLRHNSSYLGNESENSMLAKLSSWFSLNQKFLEVEPFIQTIHATDTRVPVGCEILCRVKTASGLILTNDHISEIENSKHADYYTVKLLKSILNFYSTRNASHLNGFSISLNVRAFQIGSKPLRKYIQKFIKLFPAKIKIQLEIVERDIPEITDEMVRSIGIYQSKGIKVVMDDFVLDKKNVGYLCSSNISTIKLDQELTATHCGVLVHEESLATLVEIAKKLEITVVAEGVESSLQAESLSKLGVDYLQGYLFSKPMSLSYFDSMLFQQHLL